MYEYDYAKRLAAFDHKISVADIKVRKNGDNGQVGAFVVNLKHPIPVLKEDGVYRDASTIIVETRYVDMLGPNLKGAIYRFFPSGNTHRSEWPSRPLTMAGTRGSNSSVDSSPRVIEMNPSHSILRAGFTRYIRCP